MTYFSSTSCKMRLLPLVYSQQWVVETESKRILQFPEELRNEDNEALVHRLSLAVVDHELQQNAIESEDFDKAIRQELGQEFEKGKAEGIAEGIAEGVEKEKLETARKLKAMGFSIEQIIQATGLNPSDIV